MGHIWRGLRNSYSILSVADIEYVYANLRAEGLELQYRRRPIDVSGYQQRLAALHAAAAGNANMMPALLDCVRAYATVGEMCDVLREVFGVYQETVVV